MKTVTKSIRAERRNRAIARQAEYDKLTLQEKLQLAKDSAAISRNYMNRDVKGLATKQVLKLEARIKQEQDKVLIPVKEDGAPKTRLTPEEKAARKKANKAAKNA